MDAGRPEWPTHAERVLMNKLALFFQLILSAFLVLSATPAAAQVVAQINATRTVGVAPLAVFFDASTPYIVAGKAGSEFHDYTFAWDFGDEDAGAWSVSGRSKNSAAGPEAAHVFDTPGSYTVTLSVTNQSGGSDAAALTITVEDPDAFYAGSKTTCVSSVGSFTGCPAGASQVTTSDFGEALGHATSNTRVLFRRGDSFSGSGSISGGPGIIGAFGSITSAKPQISTTGYAIKSYASDGWVVMDLALSGSTTDSAWSARRTNSNVLLYRVDVSGFYIGFSYGASILDWYNANHGENNTVHDGIFIVDGSYGGSGNAGIYGVASHMAIMGNRIGPVSGGHNIRIGHSDAGVIQHNHVFEQGTRTHLLKLHGGAFDETTGLTAQKYTERIVISGNTFGPGTTDWDVAVGPQNSGSDERVRDMIIEQNVFVSGSDARSLLLLWASECRVRNNIFKMDRGNGKGLTAVGIGRRGVEPSPSGNEVHSNTFYSNDTGDGEYTAIGSSYSTAAKNNLMYAPNMLETSMGIASAANANVISSSNPFVANTPVNPQDFTPKTGGPAVDTGQFLQQNGLDFWGDSRPAANAQPHDLGAIELQLGTSWLAAPALLN